MLDYISGKLVLKTQKYAVVDVHGLGFQVFVPRSTYGRLPETGNNIKLSVYMHVKEDGFALYGFLTETEVEAFKALITVSGVGPRVATNILSELSAGELKSAVLDENLKLLTSIPGIGKKIAQRIILEAREKIGGMPVEGKASIKEALDDAVSALVSLGYSLNTSKEAVEKAAKSFRGELNLEKLIRKSLEILR